MIEVSSEDSSAAEGGHKAVETAAEHRNMEPSWRRNSSSYAIEVLEYYCCGKTRTVLQLGFAYLDMQQSAPVLKNHRPNFSFHRMTCK